MKKISRVILSLILTIVMCFQSMPMYFAQTQNIIIAKVQDTSFLIGDPHININISATAEVINSYNIDKKTVNAHFENEGFYLNNVLYNLTTYNEFKQSFVDLVEKDSRNVTMRLNTSPDIKPGEYEGRANFSYEFSGDIENDYTYKVLAKEGKITVKLVDSENKAIMLPENEQVKAKITYKNLKTGTAVIGSNGVLAFPNKDAREKFVTWDNYKVELVDLDKLVEYKLLGVKDSAGNLIKNSSVRSNIGINIEKPEEEVVFVLEKVVREPKVAVKLETTEGDIVEIPEALAGKVKVSLSRSGSEDVIEKSFDESGVVFFDKKENGIEAGKSYNIKLTGVEYLPKYTLYKNDSTEAINRQEDLERTVTTNPDANATYIFKEEEGVIITLFDDQGEPVYVPPTAGADGREKYVKTELTNPDSTTEIAEFQIAEDVADENNFYKNRIIFEGVIDNRNYKVRLIAPELIYNYTLKDWTHEYFGTTQGFNSMNDPEGNHIKVKTASTVDKGTEVRYTFTGDTKPNVKFYVDYDVMKELKDNQKFFPGAGTNLMPKILGISKETVESYKMINVVDVPITAVYSVPEGITAKDGKTPIFDTVCLELGLSFTNKDGKNRLMYEPVKSGNRLIYKDASEPGVETLTFNNACFYGESADKTMLGKYEVGIKSGYINSLYNYMVAYSDKNGEKIEYGNLKNDTYVDGLVNDNPKTGEIHLRFKKDGEYLDLSNMKTDNTNEKFAVKIFCGGIDMTNTPADKSWMVEPYEIDKTVGIIRKFGHKTDQLYFGFGKGYSIELEDMEKYKKYFGLGESDILYKNFPMGQSISYDAPIIDVVFSNAKMDNANVKVGLMRGDEFYTQNTSNEYAVLENTKVKAGIEYNHIVGETLRLYSPFPIDKKDFVFYEKSEGGWKVTSDEITLAGMNGGNESWDLSSNSAVNKTYLITYPLSIPQYKDGDFNSYQTEVHYSGPNAFFTITVKDSPNLT